MAKRNRGLEDGKRRGLNITIFNLMEHNSDNNAKYKKADESDVKVISASLGLESLNTPLPTGWEKGVIKDTPIKNCSRIKLTKKFFAG